MGLPDDEITALFFYLSKIESMSYIYRQGNEEVMENIKDAIKLNVEDRIESGEDIQQSDSVSLTLMEVSV